MADSDAGFGAIDDRGRRRFQLAGPMVIALGWLLAGQTGAAQVAPQTECGPRVHVGEAVGPVPLPQGDLFCPLLADPKEPRTFASFLQGRSPGDGDQLTLAPFDTEVGAIGIGDSFGLFRWGGRRPGNGWQVGIAAGVFAQFDLATSSFDLLNADYLVGVPLTYRRDSFSSRVRVYHQSSHLGDEFLIRDDPERLNLAFEALELILSQAFGRTRIYAGGEYLFSREPDDLEDLLAHVGVEARAGLGTAGNLLAAVDVKSSEEQAWKPAWSVRAGIELGWARDPGHPPRLLLLVGEYYNGPSPYGQFYREEVRFLGVGLHLTL